MLKIFFITKYNGKNIFILSSNKAALTLIVKHFIKNNKFNVKIF